MLLFCDHETSGGELNDACLGKSFGCHFVVDGMPYNSIIQFMMACKAKAFCDEERYQEIMSQEQPDVISAIGSKVSPFEPQLWSGIAYKLVCQGNYAKFAQNRELLDFLIATGDSELAEASANDCTWGIGFGKNDAHALEPACWTGSNLHGKALMEVRKAIAEKESPESFFERHAVDYSTIREWAQPLSTAARRVQGINRAADPEYATTKTVQEMRSVADSVRAAGTVETQRERYLLNEFDRRYRGHIYRLLLRSPKNGGKYGFTAEDVGGEIVPVKGQLSGAEVFAAVWAKMFGVHYEVKGTGASKGKKLKSYLAEFDFSKEKVGKGAFRAYLDGVTYSVYRELSMRDLIKEKNARGRIVGKNNNGKSVPNYVSKYKSGMDPNELATKALESQVKTKLKQRQAAQNRLLLEMSYLAYYRLLKDEKVCPKWFREAAEMIFEQGMAVKEVKAKLLSSKKAKSETSFNKELCAFRSKVRSLRDKMVKTVYSYEWEERAASGTKRVKEPQEVIEEYWNDLANWVGRKRVHDIRDNIIRGLVEENVGKEDK